MDDDWGMNASAPAFSLFKSSTPEEEAMKDTFVDIVVYNRWKKSERRLYQKLKAERIAKEIQQKKLQTIDDLSSALEGLTMFKKASHEDANDPMIDDLIGNLTQMKLDRENNELKSRHTQ